MHLVKLPGFFAAQGQVLHGYNVKAAFNNMIQNGAHMAVTHGIGFDHGERSVIAHQNELICVVVFVIIKCKGGLTLKQAVKAMENVIASNFAAKVAFYN